MDLLAPASTKEDATVDLTLYIFWILKTRNTKGCNFKGYFRSFRAVVYQFWANLGIIFFVKLSNLHISCNYFPFVVCQRGVQLLYETLIENSAVLQSDSFGFVDRLTNPRIKHWNNTVVYAEKIISVATAAQIIF